MKFRVVVSVWAFLSSIVAICIGAVWLSGTIDAYSPLEANVIGSHLTIVTKQVMDGAPRFPIYMGIMAALTSIAAIYFWRSKRSIETKTYAVTLLSVLNMFIAGHFPTIFLICYFAIPKAIANAA